MPILDSKSVYIYIVLKCLLCVCATVRIQFDNTSTCKCSIIILCTLRSVAMLNRAFAPPPHSKIVDLPLACITNQMTLCQTIMSNTLFSVI